MNVQSAWQCSLTDPHSCHPSTRPAITKHRQIFTEHANKKKHQFHLVSKPRPALRRPVAAAKKISRPKRQFNGGFDNGGEFMEQQPFRHHHTFNNNNAGGSRGWLRQRQAISTTTTREVDSEAARSTTTMRAEDSEEARSITTMPTAVAEILLITIMLELDNSYFVLLLNFC